MTRFAPAPTGHLHLGHIVNAIHVWGIARASGPRNHVLIRIEDHDRRRSRVEFESAIIDDLRWLGFVDDAQRAAVVRQSERGSLYEDALARLRARGLVYACRCSRADIARHAESPSDEVRYPGTCSNLNVPSGPGAGIRVRLAPSIERFTDWRRGPQEQRPSEQCGDVLVRDRDGNWTYQFAAAADDWLQGVNLVVRGDDLLASTGRQIQLARLLGRAEPPSFFHHPLVMKSATQKLSKSDGDTGIRELRASGWTAAEVIGHAAYLGGLLDRPRPIGAAEVSSCFERGSYPFFASSSSVFADSEPIGGRRESTRDFAADSPGLPQTGD